MPSVSESIGHIRGDFVKKLVLSAALAVSPSWLAAQKQPPVRDLGPVSARSAERVRLTSGNWPGLWEFANGRVMVSDGGHSRLILFDSSLANFTVVADTTGRAPMSYGTIASPLLPFVGDSVLFLDFASRTMLLFGCDGKVARAVA